MLHILWLMSSHLILRRLDFILHWAKLNETPASWQRKGVKRRRKNPVLNLGYELLSPLSFKVIMAPAFLVKSKESDWIKGPRLAFNWKAKMCSNEIFQMKGRHSCRKLDFFMLTTSLSNNWVSEGHYCCLHQTWNTSL